MRLAATLNCMILLYLIAAVPVQAAATPTHAVGMSAGAALGSGISYRYYFDESYLQSALFARYSGHEGLELLILSAAYGWIISDIPTPAALPPTRLVLMSGIDLHNERYQQLNDAALTESILTQGFNSGLGLALEFGNISTPGLLFSLGTSYILSIDKTNGERHWDLGPQVFSNLMYNW